MLSLVTFVSDAFYTTHEYQKGHLQAWVGARSGNYLNVITLFPTEESECGSTFDQLGSTVANKFRPRTVSSLQGNCRKQVRKTAMNSLVVTNRARRLVVGVAVVALIVAVALSRVIGSDAVAAVESDLPPESFALFDGGETTLADFGGKPLVINFWASWCPACVAELSEVQAIHERFGDQITVLGIANADDRDSATALAESAGLTYTLADDPKGELFPLARTHRHAKHDLHPPRTE